MPLYLERWPHLTAMLVSACDEDALRDVVDQIGSPVGCTWQVYRGPLCIELALPVELGFAPDAGQGAPLQPDDVWVERHCCPRHERSRERSGSVSQR